MKSREQKDGERKVKMESNLVRLYDTYPPGCIIINLYELKYRKLYPDSTFRLNDFEEDQRWDVKKEKTNEEERNY